eukprot:1905399-Prymnesium_polylepis.1
MPCRLWWQSCLVRWRATARAGVPPKNLSAAASIGCESFQPCPSCAPRPDGWTQHSRFGWFEFLHYNAKDTTVRFTPTATVHGRKFHAGSCAWCWSEQHRVAPTHSPPPRPL